MSWRYHGRYTPNPYAGRAHGACDRCQFQWALSELQYQYEFRGDVLFNTRFRVCPDCMDKPYEGNRPIKLPPDPVPVLDPRVEPFLQEENTAGTFFQPIIPTPPPSPPFVYYASESGAPYITEDGTKIYVPE